MDRPPLDVEHARSHFPAFAQPELAGWAHFENAGGSYACAQTIDALTTYYVHTKLQPGHPSPAAEAAQAAMDRAHQRWAAALGIGEDEVLLGPSTTANTYVLAHAFAETLGPGDEVVVTLQDHEANRGAIERAATRSGATVREWRHRSGERVCSTPMRCAICSETGRASCACRRCRTSSGSRTTSARWPPWSTVSAPRCSSTGCRARRTVSPTSPRWAATSTCAASTRCSRSTRVCWCSAATWAGRCRTRATSSTTAWSASG